MLRRGGLLGSLIGLLLVLDGRAIQPYRSDLALWTHAVEESPQKPRPWVNLAVARARAGDRFGARLAYERAWDLLPMTQAPLYDRLEAAYAIGVGFVQLEADRPLEPTPAGGFVYEDRDWVESAARDAVLASRPVTRLSLLAQQGSSVWAYRALNLAIHGLTCLWFAGLLRALGVSRWWTTVAVTLFALHPLQMGTLMMLSGRGELLAGLWLLVACVSLMQRAWIPMGFACVLAALSKETAIVALVILPLVGWASGRWTSVVPTIGAILLADLAWAWHTIGTSVHAMPAGLDWALRQAATLLTLIGRAVILAPAAIDPDVDAWSVPACWAAVGILVAAGALAISGRTIKPVLVAGVCWVLLASMPRILVMTPRSYYHGYQFYVPLMGLALAVAGLERRA